jgi:hypothetical protein
MMHDTYKGNDVVKASLPDFTEYMLMLNGESWRYGKPIHEMQLTVRPKLIGSVPQSPAIRMEEATYNMWFNALQSGEYDQAGGYLQGKSRTGRNSVGYCCLGLLQKVVSGAVECNSDGDPSSMPSTEWLWSHGIEFFGKYRGDIVNNPTFVIRADGIDYLTDAAALNDLGFSFVEIAALLKPVTEIVP